MIFIISYENYLAPSPVAVNIDSVTSSTFALTWMEISLTNSTFSHYIVFYLPVRGPYGPITTSSSRRRQSVQDGELTMNFTGTTGTLIDLHGAVTYRIQMAVVGKFNGQENIGDRSIAIEMTTLEDSEQMRSIIMSPCVLAYFVIIVPAAPCNLNYSHLTNSSITLTWRRPDPPNGIITQYIVSDIIYLLYIVNNCLSQVFYVGINSDGNIFHDFAIQQEDSSSNMSSSYTWTSLIHGRHQFRVAAFTSKGPGEAAKLMLLTPPSNGIILFMPIIKYWLIKNM